MIEGSIDNVLGPNTSFEGTMTSDGNIRIEGIYRGRIETAGNVIVGLSGKVLADIVASTIQIQGALRGNVTARKRLEILSDGRVWGDIEVGSLLIDEGGIFRGRCIMGGEEIEPLTLPEATEDVGESDGSPNPRASSGGEGE
ncbi:MAG: polymer-forming cytoskeletal protein [Chloroflexota bacterium]|nr:polymer-forming cytoskeletal protein [Chloroflexota bacterium]